MLARKGWGEESGQVEASVGGYGEGGIRGTVGSEGRGRWRHLGDTCNTKFNLTNVF